MVRRMCTLLEKNFHLLEVTETGIICAFTGVIACNGDEVTNSQWQVARWILLCKHVALLSMYRSPVKVIS